MTKINMNNVDEVWAEIKRLDRVYIKLSNRKYMGFEGDMVDADIAAVKDQLNELWAVFDKLQHKDGGYNEANDPATDLIAMDREFNEQ